MVNNLGIELNEIAYVGDNVSKDFITANELGIKTIYVERESGIYINKYVDKKYLASYKVFT